MSDTTARCFKAVKDQRDALDNLRELRRIIVENDVGVYADDVSGMGFALSHASKKAASVWARSYREGVWPDDAYNARTKKAFDTLDEIERLVYAELALVWLQCASGLNRSNVDEMIAACGDCAQMWEAMKQMLD